jgi:hypothetical protein
MVEMARADIFTPIHKGLRSVIYELGKELQTADFTDAHATDTLVSRLKQDLSLVSSTCLLCLLHEHAGAEDQYIFPDVRTYEPKLVDTLLQEHREAVRRIAAVWKIADEVKGLSDPEERLELGAKLNHAANDLFAFYLTHLNGEESTIVPAMWKHYTDEQILAMNANVLRNTPPERLAQYANWMLPSLNINELTGILKGMKKTMPPPAFENMAGRAKKALGEDRWAMVKAKAGL